MTTRNVLLLVAVIFFVIAFFAMSDGCVGYATDNGGERSCIDPLCGARGPRRSVPEGLAAAVLWSRYPFGRVYRPGVGHATRPDG